MSGFLTLVLSSPILFLLDLPLSVAAVDLYVYSVVDVPIPGATETELFGINNAGAIVGSYTDATGVGRGFF